MLPTTGTGTDTDVDDAPRRAGPTLTLRAFEDAAAAAAAPIDTTVRSGLSSEVGDVDDGRWTVDGGGAVAFDEDDAAVGTVGTEAEEVAGSARTERAGGGRIETMASSSTTDADADADADAIVRSSGFAAPGGSATSAVAAPLRVRSRDRVGARNVTVSPASSLAGRKAAVLTPPLWLSPLLSIERVARVAVFAGGDVGLGAAAGAMGGSFSSSGSLERMRFSGMRNDTVSSAVAVAVAVAARPRERERERGRDESEARGRSSSKPAAAVVAASWALLLVSGAVVAPAVVAAGSPDRRRFFSAEVDVPSGTTGFGGVDDLRRGVAPDVAATVTVALVAVTDATAPMSRVEDSRIASGERNTTKSSSSLLSSS